MTPAKHERLLRGQTVSARKVYDSVPVEHAWPAHTIYDDMKRREISMPFNIVEGCLKALKDDGLIKEPVPKHYMQTFVKRHVPRAFPTPIEMPQGPALVVPATEPDAEPEMTIMDKLTSLAADFRMLAKHCEAAAVRAEEVAVEVDDEMKRVHADAEDLRKLQDLLASIGSKKR